MSENVDNLLLEHMKRFQAGQDRIERKLDEIVSRVGQLELGVAGLRRDFAHASREEEQSLTRAAAKASEPSFADVWDNEDDAAYDRM